MTKHTTHKQGLAVTFISALHSIKGMALIFLAILIVMLFTACYLLERTEKIKRLARVQKKKFEPGHLDGYLCSLDDKGSTNSSGQNSMNLFTPTESFNHKRKKMNNKKTAALSPYALFLFRLFAIALAALIITASVNA
jgi:hypothetical protein